MLKTIVVPLDGSSLAERAIGLAGEIASAAGARIELVLVHEPILFPGYPDAPWNVEHRKSEEEYLRTVAARIVGGAASKVNYHVSSGDIVATIRASARRLGADLIVMTTHGRTGVSRAWLGSVADGIVRTSEIPVLLLRGAEGERPAERSHVRHVLIPLDGSAEAQRVLDPALDLARAMGARVTLLRVVVPVPLFTDASVGQVTPFMVLPAADAESTAIVERETARYLDDVAEDFRGKTTEPVDVRVMTSARPATAILETAADVRADVIAMTTHGRGASRLLVGSIADKVLRGTSFPLLLYRPPTGSRRKRKARTHHESRKRAPHLRRVPTRPARRNRSVK